MLLPQVPDVLSFNLVSIDHFSGDLRTECGAIRFASRYTNTRLQIHPIRNVRSKLSTADMDGAKRETF